MTRSESQIADRCACGAKLVSCHGCAESRCLTCDPYSDYERLNRCCVTTTRMAAIPPRLSFGERLAVRWPWLSPFVVKWCHEREWPEDWSGGECRLRLNHRGPHVNFAGRSWS